MQEEKPVFVIGHKNPDTDSICSAIAYAEFKNKTAGGNYIPKRAGQVNNETKFVLEYFDVPSPKFIDDVGTQVKDLAFKKTKGVDSSLSLKKAWTLMRDTQQATMAVIKDDMLEGIIAVKDIATANMDVYETRILALARTPYSNILETIDGTMVVGDSNDIVTKGKLLIGAANPDLLENYVEEGDMLITGNRYESQLCGIEMNAGCIVVCMGAPVSKTIQKLAVQNNCKIISTPHDTYRIARLINQSTPIQYFMRKENLRTFQMDDFVNEIKSAVAKIRHREFPILDSAGRYCGMLSRRSLIDMEKKKIILVDHNEKSQAVDGIDDVDILEIIDHHRLGSLETVGPVFFRNQPLGCTATIIYQMYCESDVEICNKVAGLLCAAILSDTLMFRSPTCTPIDEKAARALAKIAGIDIEAFSEEMFRAGSSLLDKTPQEIFYQDYKKFQNSGINFGAGQVSSMDEDELLAIAPEIIEFMKTACNAPDIDMLFFMLTNIITETSTLLFTGENARDIVELAFQTKTEENQVVLKGVVSRKKQLLPKLIDAIAEQ